MSKNHSLFAVVHRGTRRIVEESGAPFDAGTRAEAVNEVIDTLFEGDIDAYRLSQCEVVDLDEDLERQYRVLHPVE